MNLYLTAQEAADLLGVDVRTVYTYVSRKKVRTLRIPGEKQSRYWRADIEQIGGIATTMQTGSPLVPVTRVTLLTPEGPFYRGRSAIELSEHATLEEVAALLWNIDGAFGTELPRLPANYNAIADMVRDLGTSERASALLPLVECANPRSYDFSPEGYARTGADVLRLYAAIAVGVDQPSTEPLHQFIARSLGLSNVYADLIRRLLILAADHELDPTTYAVRALANTGVTPYAVVLTGMNAFRGRRLRVVRSEMTARLLDEILDGTDPELPVVRRFRNGEPLAGFGSSVYGGHDPRAAAMLAAFEAQIGDDPEFIRLKRAAALAKELSGSDVNFILTAAFMRRKIGRTSESTSFVSLARTVGWIAHAIEQFTETPLTRPRTAYIGTLPYSD